MGEGDYSDWAGLLPDLLVEIAKRLGWVEDFMAFRGVCTSWRAAARKDKFVKSWPTVPLLMLAEKRDCDDREFYSLSRRKICMRLSLPEAKGKKCIEAGFGWFLTVDSSGELNLLHPFSRTQIGLPPQYSFPEYEIYETSTPFRFLDRAVLSASPSLTSDFVLMVLHSGSRFLGFWRPGSKSWTRVESGGIAAFSDLTYYQDKFYAIKPQGSLWVWDALSPDLTVADNVLCIDSELMDCCQAYLVESSGELLMITRDGIFVDWYGVDEFTVFQLDLVKGQSTQITSLGDKSIFLGHNAPFSIDSTRFPGVIRPNCIYFTDDSIAAYANTEEGGGKDMGVYDLDDGEIERFVDVQSFSLIGPPVWVAPAL